jgi:hypothetical protein
MKLEEIGQGMKRGIKPMEQDNTIGLRCVKNKPFNTRLEKTPVEIEKES